MLLRRLLYPMVFAPATDEGALAAINAAIENPGGAPASTTDDGGGSGGDEGGAGGEAAGGEGGEAGSGDGADPGAGAAAGEGAPGEQAGGEGADGGKGGKKGAGAEETAPPDPEADRGDGRNAAGRFVKKQGETDEQLAARRTADPLDGKKPGAAPDGGKKVDHVNDPIPADLKGRTRERMEGLVAAVKERDTKLEAANAELESGRELFGMIEATGADAATFARHMDVLALMCSSELADQQKAVELLRKAADTLGQQIGETPAGKDPLEGHQDLIDEVEAGETTRKRAEEIAKFRNQTAAAERRRTEAENRTKETDAAAAQKQKVIDALNGLSAELRKKDGKETYDRKHKLLVPFIRRLNNALPPDKIVAAVREAYNALEIAPAAANGNGNRAPAGSGSRQPARATSGAGGGGSKIPSSPMEALEFGLEEHARATGAR